MTKAEQKELNSTELLDKIQQAWENYHGPINLGDDEPYIPQMPPAFKRGYLDGYQEAQNDIQAPCLSRVALPSSIRVAAFDVKVIDWDHLAAATHNKFGEWSCVECAIRIDSTVNPMKVLDTLLHEINHAIYWSYGMMDDDKEERIVGTMATAWAQIYRDNPHLTKWIANICSQND